MRIAPGSAFVLPGRGLVTVTQVYVGFDEAGMPEELLDLQTPQGFLRGYPAETAQRHGRPVMRRGEARQVLSILANRFAPVTPMQAKIRYSKAEQALYALKPIEMAKVLREMLVRAQGLGDAPINIPLQEASLRGLLTRALCAEMETAFAEAGSSFRAEEFEEGDCEQALQSMARRVNPAPPPRAVARYRSVYSDYPTSGVSSELRTIARAVKQSAAANDAERRSDLNARQFALLHVVDERSRRSSG
jgi:RNA polymerase-interacting CarD/CdnL/TRCF family regulator